jgi:hypothetical protein
MPAISLNTSTSSTIPNIWSSGSSASLNYKRFLGYANSGWGIYDSTSGLPAQRSLSGEWKSGTVLGFGVGGGYNASLRAGLQLSLQASAGSANLNLNDNITVSWTKDASNFYLSSNYNYNPSSLFVSGPSATATVEGRFDINGNVRLLGKTPVTSWSTVWSRGFSNSAPLFSRTFSSTGTASASFFGGLASVTYDGVNLSTTSSNNSQLVNGVRSYIKDPVLRASLDLDQAVGRFVGLPNGLTFGASVNFGIVRASASLTLADAALNYTGSVAQTIDAKVDRITGTLNIEGKQVPYTVGSQLTLPLSTYDANNDGKLDITGLFSKQGTVTNKTEVVNDLGARFQALLGSASGTFNYLFGSRSVGGSFGPVFDSGNFNLASAAFTAYSNSWAANLGTKSLGFTLT